MDISTTFEELQMVTRQQAEQQADTCFLYHAGAFIITTVALSMSGSRAAAVLGGTWGLAVLGHAAALYGIPESREKILMWTASGMEERQHAQEAIGEASQAATTR